MTERAFLDVENSLTGRRWRGPDMMLDRASETIQQTTGCSIAVARVLARNGVAPEQTNAYLSPRLKDLMPDPRSLKDMETAATRLKQAVECDEKIAIFADYDVDGGSSAALLVLWLRDLGRTATVYVPDRTLEGYGPNIPAMEKLAASHDLIICVDCGTLSHDPIAAAKGADVIVVDHHLGGAELPPALAVVNPNRQDEENELQSLCAAGVVFLLLVETNRQNRATGHPTPNLIGLLDLVALATVADVAPLEGLNRAFVRQGLAIMAQRNRPGLVALFDLGKIDTAPSPYHLGFVLGPRINAGGRIGKADLGARLLSTADPHEAASIAEQLDYLNKERREIEAAVKDQAMVQIEDRDTTGALSWAAGKNWHPGVLGIVASRVKETTGRPSVVLGIDGDVVKGSGRSVSGIDLGTSIQRLADEGLIAQGGGHAMAAGLSLSKEQLEPAMARLEELLSKQGAGSGEQQTLKVDALLMPSAASPELIEEIATAGPFGAGNPAPRFAFADQMISGVRRVGENHLKFSFSDPGGGGKKVDAIAFRAMDSELGAELSAGRSNRFHLAGQLEINTWQGRKSAQLRLDDAASIN